ncbi:LysM peptidoglycan-binding domain-containing protein, partial [Paenibacillus solisilvae]
MKIHIVKKGDSLFSIAQKYNVSLEEVLQLNPSITNPDVIDVGMKVKIPTSKPGDMEIMHQHVVQQGDSLWKLSKAWGVPLSDMIKANPQLKNPNVLLTGEIVNIPKASAPSTMPEMNEHAAQQAGQGSGHHPLHPMSMMHGVQGLVGKIPTAPFIGKKPTGQKPITAPIATAVPTPVPTPLPAPVPAPMPVVEKPIEKPIEHKQYPVHIQYEQHIDLFQQYGVPATEVMSLYEMPKMPEAVSPAAQAPHYGYGNPMTSPASVGGYGYPHVMPTAVSPANTSPDWCPPEAVAGASNLPWGAPTPLHYGSWDTQMVSPAGMDDCGPDWVSPASMGPQGYGYGYEQPTAVSPVSMSPQGYGYGYEQPTAVSPASMGPQGYGYGYEQPTAVSPVSMGPQGYGYGYEQPTAVSPASMGPQGYGYGYEQPTAVSPVSMGPQGYGYGYEQPTAVSPASMGPQGYGYGYEQPTAVSPASMGPQGYGYGY